MAGKFISFEGGEGSGKSTQIKRLAAALEGAGKSVVVTREPGGAPAAEDIRALLVSGAVDRWSPMAEVLLNYAAREMHVSTTIRPALERGDWVLCDRFFDSTLAYQGYGGGVPIEKIATIREAVLGSFAPDLTLILDISVEEGLDRAGRRLIEDGNGEDRFERKGKTFHQRLRQGFRKIAAQEPGRCRMVDAAGDAEEVAARVRALVTELMGVALP